MNQKFDSKDCQWLVFENGDGNYVHPETEAEREVNFCLIKEFFTKCYGKCEDFNDIHI